MVQNYYTNTTCRDCECFGWHNPNCPSATPDDFRKQAGFYFEQSGAAKRRAARYWDMLQRLTGKYAILKQENNKLRAKAEGE